MGSLRSPPSLLRADEVTLEFSHLTEGDASKGFVPGYHFRILNGTGEDVGHINFRVGDSEHIRLAAGHIGFEIKPPHRGHGYGRQACFAIAPWVTKVSQKVLITSDPDDVPSLKTIERICAVYLDEVDVPEDDPHYSRGSRRKRRFEWEPEKKSPKNFPVAKIRPN